MHAPTPITAGTVGIFAPSSPFPEQRYDAGLRRLRELGLTPVEHPDLRATKGYLAGDDDTRLNAIHDLLDDDRVYRVVVEDGIAGPGGTGPGLGELLGSGQRTQTGVLVRDLIGRHVRETGRLEGRDDGRVQQR